MTYCPPWNVTSRLLNLTSVFRAFWTPTKFHLLLNSNAGGNTSLYRLTAAKMPTKYIFFRFDSNNLWFRLQVATIVESRHARTQVAYMPDQQKPDQLRKSPNTRLALDTQRRKWMLHKVRAEWVRTINYLHVTCNKESSMYFVHDLLLRLLNSSLMHMFITPTPCQKLKTSPFLYSGGNLTGLL